MNQSIQNNPQGTDGQFPLLMEIGTEEIPSRFIPGAISGLEDISRNIFDEFRIGYKNIRTFATPRRLVLMMDGVTPFQKNAVKEIFGPSRNIAFDNEGNPTRAASGFAKSLGVTVADLTVKKKGKGEYVVAIIEEKGMETRKVLPGILKKIILSLHFPKTMRWGDGNFAFVRPIHWILAMYGPEVIREIELDGIRSGNITRGHRFLSPAGFQIKDIASYINMLRNNFVILDHEKRKQIIREGIIKLLDDPGWQPVIDEELLDTVNFLVEYPFPVLCGFSEEYLDLPKELLITVMRDHQKYFAVQDSTGNLLNHFIVISNTRAENAETIRVGAERVIKARFDDAKFYFREDSKIPLADRVENLRLVTFSEKLGSLFDKTGRLVAMASYLAEILNPSLKDKLTRSALLSKTDLITGVVREFPELQGVIGKYYAYASGEESEVAEAMEEQYLPNSFGGRLPGTDIGALLSLSDKIDNIASFFSIGLIPTGSEDPFALRRQSMGVISIMLDRGYEITLREVFKKALENLRDTGPDANTLENIINFMEQRTEFILSSMRYEADVIKSVLCFSSIRPLKTIVPRINAINKFRKEEIFADFLLAIKRVCNILPKTALPSVKAELLLEKSEKDLYNYITDLTDRLKTCIENGKFYEGIKIFAGITVPINNFFDNVLVMDKQEEIKMNRLALMNEIWSSASMIADFSKLI